MTKTEPRQSCTFRSRPRQQQTEAWQQTIDGLQGPGVTNPTVSDLAHPSSASQDADSEDMDVSASWKSRLSAPQLQAQLAPLTEWARLGRLRCTLLSKEAWQQFTRIEDLCHTNVSHKWLYHLDACAGSVLTPHDYITNVQKRLGNRAWTGFGESRTGGSFLDPQRHTEKPAAPPKPRGDTTHAFTLWCAV